MASMSLLSFQSYFQFCNFPKIINLHGLCFLELSVAELEISVQRTGLTDSFSQLQVT